MSFYGNVYYQFIDTFYKLIIYNHKDNNKLFSFPNANEVKEKTEIQAIGREGTIDLNAGNKWIQFTTDPETNIVSLWHAKPENIDSHRAGLLYGIRYRAHENETESENHPLHDPDHPSDVIKLEEGDYIWTSGAYYDEAGHIINDADSDGLNGKYQVCYQLPKSTQSKKTDNLIKITGGLNVETGEITTTDFNETNTIIKQVIQNKKDISNNDTTVKNLIDGNDNRIKVLEDLYSDNSNNLFKAIDDKDKPYIPADKNFSNNFGSITSIFAAWNKFIKNNSYIEDYLKSDESGLDKYFSVEEDDIVIKDVSTIICLITGCIKALKKDLENTIANVDSKVTDIAEDINSIQVAANTAVGALGTQADNSQFYIFNTSNTIAEAFGLSDDKNSCFFNEENSVRDTVENLDSKINTKVDNNIFNEYKTTIYTQTETDDLLSTKVNNDTLNNYYNKEEIDISLSAKANNTDLDNYYNKEEIDGIIKSLRDEISTLKDKINTLESYHSNESVENPEDEVIPEE